MLQPSTQLRRWRTRGGQAHTTASSSSSSLWSRERRLGASVDVLDSVCGQGRQGGFQKGEGLHYSGARVRTSTTVVRETGAPVGGLRGPGEEGGLPRVVASPDSRFGCAAPTATRHRERDSESKTSVDSLPPVSASRTCGEQRESAPATHGE